MKMGKCFSSVFVLAFVYLYIYMYIELYVYIYILFVLLKHDLLCFLLTICLGFSFCFNEHD